jgi:hypothetical protein
MKRLVLLLALLAALLFGCGGGGPQSANELLAETSANLGKIKSGNLALELIFSTKDGERAGFNLEGPFELRSGSSPEAQLDYTQIAGKQTAAQTFIMTGDKAYVRMGGATFELPAETAGRVRSTLGATGSLGVIDLRGWVQDPDLAAGEEVGGAETDRITGRLNVATVVTGLVAIASQFGGTTPLTPLEGKSAEQVEQAVDRATIDVWTGKEDRLLRKLEIAIEFSPAAEQVESLVGAAVHFTLGISNPNETVTIEKPTNVQPYSPGS